MSSRFVIAAAQTVPVKGDIERGIREHEEVVRRAVDQSVDLVVFPELSLTGYQPELAESLQLESDDPRLRGLRELAGAHGITIVAGAPMASPGGKPRIGALAFRRTGLEVYEKQHLDPSEMAHFLPGTKDCVIDVRGRLVALAICADTSHPSHAQAAAGRGASLYAAGVSITADGYDADAALMRKYARDHRMAVLMANYAFTEGDRSEIGRSAVWDEQGQLVVSATEEGGALLIAETTAAGWLGRLVPI